MNSFWIAIIVSMISIAGFIWFSVERQSQKVISEASNNNWLLLPIVFISLSPWLYSLFGSYDKQVDWLKVNDSFSELVAGSNSDMHDMDIRDLVLALRTAVDKDPENGGLWFMLAETYYQLGMIDLADQSMERAHRVEMNPSWLVANAQILSARGNDSDIPRSINLLRQAISLQPDHQRALLMLGFLYMKQQNYDIAISVFKRIEILLEAAGRDTQMIKQQIEIAQSRILSNSQNN